MNLYTGQPESDESCVATDLEQRYKMFLAEGYTPAEAAREAKEIIKFEWLVDQGRDQDQAALLVQMPLRAMMMTTFSQQLADLGYPARVQWLLDRGLYTYEEATVFAFQKFDILVVMHDEVELAAGRQHRIQDYFSGKRRNVQPKRKPTFHPQLGERFGPPVAKVAAVKPTFREMVPPQLSAEIESFRSTQPPPFTTFSNLDRLLKAPVPKPEDTPPVVVPEVAAEPTPSSSKAPSKKETAPVVAKTTNPVPTAKPAFKWSWKSARATLTAVPAGFGQDDETAEPASTLPESKEVSTPEAPKAKVVPKNPKVDAVPEIPKTFNVPPPPLPIPPPPGSQTLDPALLTQPVFAWACPIVPPTGIVSAVTTPEVKVINEPPPLPPELPKPPEPEPEPVFKISTITTEPTKKVDQSKFSWANPALSKKPKPPEEAPEEQPRPIPSLAAPTPTKNPACDTPRPIPSLAAVPVTIAKNTPQSATLKWSSTISTINTHGNNIVITPAVPEPDSYGCKRPPVAPPLIPEEPEKSDEFSLNWDKAWGMDEAAGLSGTSRWANFQPTVEVEEDPNNPYGVPLLNQRAAQQSASVPKSSNPSGNKVEDLYAMLNRFDGK